MRYLGFALLSTGLMLAGCAAGPCADDPASTCVGLSLIPPAVAAPPDAGTGQPYVGPDGVTYVDGYPVYLVDGEEMAMVYDPTLGWGYYDGLHRWHGAPRDLRARLDHFHPGGRGLPPPGARAASFRPGSAPGGQAPRQGVFGAFMGGLTSGLPGHAPARTTPGGKPGEVRNVAAVKKPAPAAKSCTGKNC